jgi:hypothetical protein
MNAAARVLCAKRRVLDEDEMMAADWRQWGGQLARGMRGARTHDAQVCGAWPARRARSAWVRRTGGMARRRVHDACGPPRRRRSVRTPGKHADNAWHAGAVARGRRESAATSAG